LLTWNARLFDKSLFSDLTVHLDGGRSLELHSFILVKKSSFFAEHCKGTAKLTLTNYMFPLPIKKDDEDEGDDETDSETDTENEKTDDKMFDQKYDKKDVPWSTLDPHIAIRQMLRYCYTGEYVVLYSFKNKRGNYSVRNTRGNLGDCLFHTYMNFLACTYGIEDLKIESERLFAIAMEVARSRYPQEMMGAMEDLYTTRATVLLSDSFKNALYAQAKAVINKNLMQIQDYMPEVLKSVVDANAKTLECVRCGAHLTLNNRSKPKSGPAPHPHLCPTCSASPFIKGEIFMQTTGVKNGTQLVLWTCQGCQRTWSTEGRKVRNMPLEDCGYCKRMFIGHDRYIYTMEESTCLQCKTLWKVCASILPGGKPVNMQECICCP
jgi:hypothetical protein